MAHIRGGDDIGNLQRILLNKQQLVSGAQDFILQTPFSRYQYCEHNEVTFLWDKLSSLGITVEIQGAWRPTKRHPQDAFLMESFIDKGYTLPTLVVLNNVRVYMKVLVLSDMMKQRGNKMAQWALRGDGNVRHKWMWPQRRTPTSQNLKV